MLLKIHPDNPEQRKIIMAVDCLKKGGVIIYPTDTVYGLGCDIYNSNAVERICKIKGMNPKKANLSILFSDFSHLSDFTSPIETSTFRVMKKALPGPFTFILKANSNVPKIFKHKKNTVGIRIPESNIAREIVKELGSPIVTTTIHDTDEIIAYTTDPEIIYERYKNIVDIVIDGGFGNNMPSTIVDCSDGDFEVVRQGLGDLEQYL